MSVTLAADGMVGLLVAGYWLLVAGCWLLVTGYWLLVAGCWFFVPWAMVGELSNQAEGLFAGLLPRVRRCSSSN
jgi:hypothetical protein